MPKLIKEVSKKVGASPGTLVHIGEKKVEKPKITVIDYGKTFYKEEEAKTVEECLRFKDKKSVKWINIDGIHDVSIIEKIGKHFGFHPLILEDIVDTEQRQKVEDYGNYMFIVLKVPSFDEKSEALGVEQFSLILGQSFVISFQEREGLIFNRIRERIKNTKGHHRVMGADYLAYSLIDAVVDSYYSILEKIGENIESLADELTTKSTPKILQTINKLRGEIVLLRKSLWSSREVVNSLEKSQSILLKKTTAVYLRDVYDNTIQIIEMLETFREMLGGMVEIYFLNVSNRLNEIIKVLTIITTVFMPLTFIVGVYGMNFKFMPELVWKWGYPFSLLMMFITTGLMLYYFKKKEWL